MASSTASPSSSSPYSANNLRILVERNPPESKLSELNIKCWPKWGCPPGKYQLKFDAEETCYLVKGKVKVYPRGSSSSSSSSTSEDQFVEFGAGDLVIIPKGLSCTWDVSVAVDKYYKFESSSSS
ncbi:Cupin_3 domain-containing protein [Psidium guajava]|nr:Cupin_3 domain-containing protein [Psidium guajava]